MQEQVKLVVAEQPDKQKIQFLVFMSEEQKVGEGGFGVVRKAIRNDKPNQVLVAKIIPYQDDKKREKIEKQISVIRKLPPHPNLVRVQPLKCYSSNNYYIFMEYCPDGTLEDLRKKKNNMFSQAQIFDIFYQLMNGYKILWNTKILHQDLKLENVLIKDGRYKLTDFGFSIFYEGVKHGNIRQGTLPYMPLEKLTEKQYYATTKSDVYSMGIMLFKLITGHHPYVQTKIKEYKAYLKQLKINQLYLKPNFSSRFSMKFQHFFDLVLKMVAKSESARINFDVVYQYIENQQLFDEIRKRVHAQQKAIDKLEYQKLLITGQSEAIAIHFTIPQNQQMKYKQEKQVQNKNRQSAEEQKAMEEIQKYIVSHRILVYYFDRLTRRIYIQKLRKFSKCSSFQYTIIQKLILGLLLFCRKITQNLLKQCKNGIVFPINIWKAYRKNNSNLIKMIERDENYLQDLVIDCLSESSQTKIKDKKELLDKSKQSFQVFKKIISDLLQSLLKQKASGLKPDDRQNLITISYIKSGIQIFANYQKCQRDAIYLQNYFRSIQTEDTQVLFSKVAGGFLDKQIDFIVNLGDEQ